jgi:hypothetical protein
MPLPQPDTDFPPRFLAEPFDDIAEAHDWWVGNPEDIAARYTTGTTGSPSRPGWAGGMVGMWARLWWGKPLDVSEPADRVHIPIARDLARTSSSLVFANGITVSAPKDTANKAASERIDRILNTPTMHATLLSAGESAAALGGVYLRVVWDRLVKEHAWIDVVDADHAIPEFKWGTLVAATFWSKLPGNGGRDKEVWRHLERHSKGCIEHALYCGTDGNIGTRILDLAAHESTKHLPAAMKLDADGVYLTEVNGLTVGYVPNAQPFAKYRHDTQLKNLGYADINASNIPLFDKCDEWWSALSADIDIAKGRIIVSEDALDVGPAGQGSSFNSDRRIFTTLASAGNADEMFHAEQFDIRVEKHLAAIDAMFRQIIRASGYSPASFGMTDDGGAMTATESRNKREMSINTRTTKARLFEAVLSDLLAVQIPIDAKQFGTGAVLSEALEITFPPAVADSDLERAAVVQAMDIARAASTAVKVAYMHPTWDEKRVDDEVILVRSEFAIADPLALGSDAQFGATQADPDGEAEPVFGSIAADDAGDDLDEDDIE